MAQSEEQANYDKFLKEYKAKRSGRKFLNTPGEMEGAAKNEFEKQYYKTHPIRSLDEKEALYNIDVWGSRDTSKTVASRMEGAGKQSQAKADAVKAKRSPQRAAAELAKKKAEKSGPKKPAGSFTYEGYQKMKKNGTYKGFDGMNGVSGKGVKG